MSRIKICGLRRPEDIAAVNEARPDYCGFIVEYPKSRRSIDRTTLRELVRGLREKIIPVGVFVNAPKELVVHYGVMQARTIALFYFLLAFSHCIAAVLRGSGHAAVPMIVMLCVWCLFRVSYITVAVHYIPDIRVIFWAYPLTWSISSVIFLYLFLRGKWVYGFEKKR